MQSSVFRFVNHTHPAATELFHDAVMRDGAPDERFGPEHLRLILGAAFEQVNESEGLASGMRAQTPVSVESAEYVLARTFPICGGNDLTKNRSKPRYYSTGQHLTGEVFVVASLRRAAIAEQTAYRLHLRRRRV